MYGTHASIRNKIQILSLKSIDLSINRSIHRGEPMPLDEDLKRDLDFDIRSLLAEEVTLNEVFEKHYVNLNDTWQVDDVTVETARELLRDCCCR